MALHKRGPDAAMGASSVLNENQGKKTMKTNSITIHLDTILPRREPQGRARRPLRAANAEEEALLASDRIATSFLNGNS
jgi:hypothetical protein